MAEEQNTEKSEKKPASPMVKNGIMFAMAIVIPAILAFVLYSFIIKPKFGPEEEMAKTPTVVDPFPVTMTEMIFDEQQISVATEDPDMVAPMLITQVTLMCRDPETAAVVDSRKSLFAAMILKMHQGRTRAELNDSLVRNSILQQIKQQSNILLKRINPEADLMVLDALHLKFTMVDL
tara:strand:- start:470 stop:1003 length:534 start_codon:yes stop_codon:yes gene_type:complete